MTSLCSQFSPEAQAANANVMASIAVGGCQLNNSQTAGIGAFNPAATNYSVASKGPQVVTKANGEQIVLG